MRQAIPGKTDVQIEFSTGWLWPNDFDTQTWPRSGSDVPPYQKNDDSVLIASQYSPSLHTTKTDTHRQYENITLPACARGNIRIPLLSVLHNRAINVNNL